MIGKLFKGCAAAIAAVAVCTSVFAADLVDNPSYLEWAKYKPGTLVRMEMVTEAAGQNIKMGMTTTLKEVTAEKVVLEMKTTMDMPGMAPQVKTITEPAKIEKAQIKPTSPEQMPNCKVISKGTEDVKVGDKTFKCNWYEVEVEQQGMKVTSKMWTCDEVLGKMVKNESKMDMGKTSMKLVEIKVVK